MFILFQECSIVVLELIGESVVMMDNNEFELPMQWKRGWPAR